MPIHRILIVEDEPIIAADLEDRLRELGYGVVGTPDTGEAALELFVADPPDLVLMDVHLAGKLDGIATALRMHAIRKVPLVFLTSNSDEATFQRARTSRPSAFISKPFRGRDLVHAIDLALSRGDIAPALPAQTDTAPVFPQGESALLIQDRLFLKVKERLSRVMLDDILWVKADDYYCRLKTDEQEYLITKTLKKFADLLPSHANFYRSHRSYLVNLSKVTEIGEIYLFVGEHQLPLSRSRRGELLERIANL